MALKNFKVPLFFAGRSALEKPDGIALITVDEDLYNAAKKYLKRVKWIGEV